MILTQSPPPFTDPFPIFTSKFEPFSTPSLVVWDSIRVFDQVFGGVLIVMLLWLVFTSSMVGRRIMAAGIMGLAVSAVGTEFEALGSILTYRLVANTLGLVVIAIGVVYAYTRGEP